MNITHNMLDAREGRLILKLMTTRLMTAPARAEVRGQVRAEFVEIDRIRSELLEKAKS